MQAHLCVELHLTLVSLRNNRVHWCAYAQQNKRVRWFTPSNSMWTAAVFQPYEETWHRGNCANRYSKEKAANLGGNVSYWCHALSRLQNGSAFLGITFGCLQMRFHIIISYLWRIVLVCHASTFWHSSFTFKEGSVVHRNYVLPRKEVTPNSLHTIYDAYRTLKGYIELLLQ